MALLVLAAAAGFHAPLLRDRLQCAAPPQRTALADVRMINLFGNNEESVKRREALSFREARPGDRKVTFRKPNSATDGLVLGLKFRESFGKAVYIDKIIPNTEAARLEKQIAVRQGATISFVVEGNGDEARRKKMAEA